MIEELKRQIAALQGAVENLESVGSGGSLPTPGKRRGRPPGWLKAPKAPSPAAAETDTTSPAPASKPIRKKREWTAAARKAHSNRQKMAWALRKKVAAKKVKTK